MSVYEGIMKGLSEALEHAEGKLELRSNEGDIIPPKDYAPDEIKLIRTELGMTQVRFASVFGVSPKTVEAWEAGRNTPEGPARRLLAMVQSDPQLPERYNIVVGKA